MTVIHRKHRFIFLKSQKTAGSAIEAHVLTRTPLGGDIWHTSNDIRKHGLPLRRRNLVLPAPGGRLIAFDEPRPPIGRYLWRFRIAEHHTAESLARRAGGLWDRALKATSVRNPWDIMVSAWSWRRGGRGGAALPITASFDEWARAAMSGDEEWRARAGAYDPHTLMHQFLFIRGHRAVDVVIRHDRIDEGLRELAERLDLPVPPLTIREKVSARKGDYRSYYDDSLAEEVGRYFIDIISLCDYSFDPPSTPSSRGTDSSTR